MTIEATITGIHDANKREKLNKLSRSLAEQMGIPYTLSKSQATQKSTPDLQLVIQDITHENRVEKYNKALQAAAEYLDEPLSKARRPATGGTAASHEHAGEPYRYPLQQELADKWALFYASLLDTVYRKVCAVFSLPDAALRLSKAATDPIRYSGKIVYNPKTGEPINQSQLKAFVAAVETFINGQTKEAAKQFTLDNVAVQRIIRHLAKTSTTREMHGLTLGGVTVNGHKFDWIAENFTNMRDALGGAVSGYTAAQYQVGMDYLAQKITAINDDMRNAIKDTLLWNIRNRVSQKQTSLDLFEKFGELNKDWKRVADTEAVNTQNLAYIKQVQADNGGKAVYVKRFEVQGACKICEKYHGAIALFSDKPLPSFTGDGTAKYAVWEGQEPTGKNLVYGAIHPNCRGSWDEYVPGMDTLTAAGAEMESRGNAWNAAVQQARKENPNLYWNGGEMYGKITAIYEGKGETLRKGAPKGNQNARKDSGVQHDGEYVLTKDGKKDFGEIPAKTGLKAGKIRLQTGYHDDTTKKGRGEKHIERSDRLAQLKQNGYANARDFVEDVAQNYEAIYRGKGAGIIVTKTGKDHDSTIYVELTPSPEGSFYDVTGGLVSNKRYTKNKTPLWVKPTNGVQTSDAGRAPTSQRTSPSAISGTSDNPLSPESGNKSRDSFDKSLTWSGYKLAGRKKFAGFDISIENKKGSTRRGVDTDGHKWASKMYHDYGYIRGTEGVDGDHVDVYLGGTEDCRNVYIVHQKDPDTGTYDEDKVMLGFATLDDAKAAYRRQYDRAGFMGDVTTMPIDEFREKVLSKKYHGRMVKSLAA